jgi:hypothetical protein
MHRVVVEMGRRQHHLGRTQRHALGRAGEGTMRPATDLDDHFKIWTLGSVIAWRIGSGDSRPTPILVWGDLGSQPYLIQSPTGEVVRHRAGCCPDAPWLMHYPDMTAATQSLIFDWQAARAEQRRAEVGLAEHD